MQQIHLNFNDIHRKYRYQSKRSIEYVNNLNEILVRLNTHPISSFSSKFYKIIQKIVRDLLIDWNKFYRLNPNEINLLHNSIEFFQHQIDKTSDLSWFFDSSLIQSIVDCLNNIDQLLFRNETKSTFKAFINLFNLFSIVYRRFPSNNLDLLFEGILNCLTSVQYDKIFRKLKPSAKSMKTKESFFLSHCPIFLCSKLNFHHQSHSTIIIEQILETMIPRYASILDQHIKFIKQWNSAMMHAVYHVFSIGLLVKNQLSQYASGQPLQWLTDHIIHILKEPCIHQNIDKSSSTCEILLIESALKLLSTFVHEPDLLIYIQQLKIQSNIRLYSSSAHESIVYYTYLILSYIMDEDAIKVSEKDSGRLLSNVFDSLRKQIRLYSENNRQDITVEKQISLLAEAIQVLVEHDQIKSEILRQNALPLLINNFQLFNVKSQRLILESIGSMTFYHDAARLLRENKQFLHTVENKQQTNVDDGVRKAADKILWNLIDEPEKVAKSKEKKENIAKDDKDEQQTKTEEYLYDIMISYCHADKELVYKIHRFLADQGFKIWIDREQMYGPAMQAMAQAVENSEFVLLCMSSSYKRSVYCQAEAEYAFQCKRRLIPLIVRPEYRPDGWLGLLIGSRIYIDFGKLDFKKACESLLNEMTLQRKEKDLSGKNPPHTLEKDKTDFKDVSSTVQTPKESSSNDYKQRNTSASKYRSKNLKQWTSNDILDFLFDSKLYLMMPLCESLNGQGLVKLFEMCQTDPAHFYEQLNDELHSRSNQFLPIGVYTQFLTEIEDWTDSKVRPLIESNIDDSSRPQKRSETSTPTDVPRLVNNKNGTSTPTSIVSTRSSAKNDTNDVNLSRFDNIKSNASTPSATNNIKNYALIRTLSSSSTNSIKNTISSTQHPQDATNDLNDKTTPSIPNAPTRSLSSSPTNSIKSTTSSTKNTRDTTNDLNDRKITPSIPNAPTPSLSSSPTNSIKSTTSSTKSTKADTKTPNPISSPANTVKNGIPTVPTPLIPTQTSRNNTPTSTSSSSSSSSRSNSITSKRSLKSKPTENIPTSNASLAFSSIISMKNGQPRSIPLPSPTQLTRIY